MKLENPKVLVVRQPWAWLIVNGHKDIENRSWSTKHRGPLLIQHSTRKPSRGDLEDARRRLAGTRVNLPDTFDCGGIVGIVEIERFVTKSSSRWFVGPIGWVLANPRRTRFIPLKGRLGLFDPPVEILAQLRVIR